MCSALQRRVEQLTTELSELTALQSDLEKELEEYQTKTLTSDKTVLTICLCYFINIEIILFYVVSMLVLLLIGIVISLSHLYLCQLLLTVYLSYLSMFS